jgi:hypothetical protein
MVRAVFACVAKLNANEVAVNAVGVIIAGGLANFITGRVVTCVFGPSEDEMALADPEIAVPEMKYEVFGESPEIVADVVFEINENSKVELSEA